MNNNDIKYRYNDDFTEEEIIDDFSDTAIWKKAIRLMKLSAVLFGLLFCYFVYDGILDRKPLWEVIIYFIIIWGGANMAIICYDKLRQHFRSGGFYK